MTEPAALATAIASRICHDLVSPVGAVVNGLDLIRELGGDTDGPELEMIGLSAARASDLLQFYRIAFGTAADDASGLSGAELQHLVAGYASAIKTDLVWKGAPDRAYTRSEAQMLSVMVLSARAMLGLRGQLLVADSDGVEVTADGPQAACSDERAAILNGTPAARPEPRDVEFILLHDACRRLNRPLRIEAGEGRVVLRA